MRPLPLVVPLCAVLFTGCDLSSTHPLAPSAGVPDRPDKLLLVSSGWTLVSLPFAPNAINDAGVIVGSQNAEAVRWENGTLAVLPHYPGLPGPYVARDISPKGLIVGNANGHGLLWTSPTSVPMEIHDPSYPTQPVEAVAVNDNYTVVGDVPYYDVFAYSPWRWTPFAGFRYMPVPYSTAASVTGLNASGYVSGYANLSAGDGGLTTPAPVRWDPSGNYTVLWYGTSFAVGMGINDAGTVVGNFEHYCSSDPLNTGDFSKCPDVSALWFTDGTMWGLYAAPAKSYGVAVSNPGRVIGNYFQGAGYPTLPWTLYNGTLSWLSSPDVTPPRVRDVNYCGSIIGLRFDSPGTGYLWRRGGLYTYACDVTVSTALTLQ